MGLRYRVSGPQGISLNSLVVLNLSHTMRDTGYSTNLQEEEVRECPSNGTTRSVLPGKWMAPGLLPGLVSRC
jgi:hypothetical protein